MRTAAWTLRTALVALGGLAALGCKHEIAGGSADGAAVYAQACATCHGADGRPTETMTVRLGVKDLTDPALHERLTDEAIREQIVHGSDNRKMPAFGGALTDDQVDAVVKYLRTLRAD